MPGPKAPRLGEFECICILVTSTTTGPGGSMVSALASQAKFLLHKQKVRAQFPIVS